MANGWSARPASWAAPGHVKRGSEDREVLDQVSRLTGDGWTDYTTTAPSGGQAFTLSAVTTPPTQGNSTYSARFRRPTGSDLCFVEIYILIGSTFSAGNGVYRFLLPFNASAASILAGTGTGYILDTGTANRTGVTRCEAAGYVNWYLNGSSAAITNTGSGTAWATGDIIALTHVYEPA